MNKESSENNRKREILTFFLDNNLYGLWLDALLEVTSLPEAGISRVPLTTEALLGLISLRGRVVTLLNIRALFSLLPVLEYSRAVILLFNYQDDVIGFPVDRLGEVLPAGSGVLTDNTVYDITDANADVSAAVSAAAATSWQAMFTVDGRIIPLVSLEGLMNSAFKLQH